MRKIVISSMFINIDIFEGFFEEVVLIIFNKYII